MQERPFLAAFDLDGTLFNQSAELSATTIDALGRLASPHRHFAAATGRSHRSAAARLAPAKHLKWAVCNNGAVLYNLHDSQVVEHCSLDGDYVEEFLANLQVEIPGLAWAWESLEGGFFGTEQFSTMTSLATSAWQLITKETPPPTDALKLLLAHPDLKQSALANRISQATPNSLAITSSGGEFLEATASGVTKASQLERLRQRLGVQPQDTVAFGDNLNDLEMLRWAGTGYAMANAHHEAIAAADAVTRLRHDDDGVIDVLISLLD